MIGLVHFPFISKRKQLLILKFLIPIALFVVAFMKILSNTETFRQPIIYKDIGKTNSTQMNKMRRIIPKENIDEFVMIVLKEVTYHEINIKARSLNRREYYDEGIEADKRKVIPGLGEYGQKAFVPKKYEKTANRSIDMGGINQVLNEMISVTRSLPDARERACRSISYDLDHLPTMSIIIIFKNEPYITLVRMLHGIFMRTPPHLLLEVILVDDFSRNRDLLGKLERYLATNLPAEKIRLLRMHTHAGLIRARLIGAHIAVGDVLVFLDAHCEVNEQWAEPMLQRIKEDRTVVVCPIIDVIDEKTMEYQYGKGDAFLVGGFKWTGHFDWIHIPEREEKRKKFHHSPTRTPTMAGGLFGIDRKYFWEMGSYDPGMKVWGGENLEMSFRIWQCGGSIEVIPCSHVGHLFRSHRPYKFTADDKTNNFARVAEVWLDNYKDLLLKNQYFKVKNKGDVKLRKAFRHRKKCQTFQWYLDKIYPEKFKMEWDSRYYGQVQNPQTNYCIDYWDKDADNYTLSVYNCSNDFYMSQEHFYSKTGQLRKEASCARVSRGDSQVQMVWCEAVKFKDNSFRWDYDIKTKQLKNREAQKCLTIVRKERGRPNEMFSLVMEKCRSYLENQKWEFRPGRPTSPKRKS